MSEPLPPPPPMPPDDRELDEFLAGRSALSRHYRDDAASVQAPRSLDAAILDAAKQAVVVPAARPRPSRLQRWRLPLSLAATLVVGIGVLREADRDPSLPPPADEVAAVSSRTEVAVLVQPQAIEARKAQARSAPMPASVPAPTPAPAAEAVAPRDRHERGRAVAASPAPVIAERAAAAPAPPAPVAAAPIAALADAGAATANAVPAEPFAVEAKRAMMPAPLASAPAPRAAVTRANSWRAARYQGLLLGEATYAEVAARLALPSAVPPASGRVSLPRVEAPLAGRGELQFSSDEHLQRVHITLSPPRTPAEIEAAVQPGAAFQRLAQAPEHCPSSTPETVPAEVYPQVRLYPEAGLYLVLPVPDQVSGIGYLPACP